MYNRFVSIIVLVDNIVRSVFSPVSEVLYYFVVHGADFTSLMSRYIPIPLDDPDQCYNDFLLHISSQYYRYMFKSIFSDIPMWISLLCRCVMSSFVSRGGLGS